MTDTDFAAQNKCAERWLLEFPERRQSYIDQLGEFTELASVRYTGMPGGSAVSSPTQSKAISLVTLDESRLWIMTIEDTERTLTEKKLAFLDARRWVDKQIRSTDVQEIGRPAWVDATQARYADWFWRRYGRDSYPDPKTVTQWWNEIINITCRIAIDRRCIFKRIV